MNPLDIGVIAVIGLSAVFAFARGFVREALSIVAWIGAGIVTLYGWNYAYTAVEPLVHNPLLSNLIAIGGVFLVSLILLTIVTGLLARSVRSSALSGIDRTLGFIFGLLRGALIVSLACLLLDTVQPSEWPPWVKQAKSMPYLQQGADVLRTVLPAQWREKAAAAVDETKQMANPEAQAQQAIRAYVNPKAQATDQPQAPSYKPADQKQLNRLMDNQR
ncbi:MAG: CvpA family protein [Alphaproteobacteria bacterium]|nr:CvpA family protein [Alphaproteobacteria bacterium]